MPAPSPVGTRALGALARTDKGGSAGTAARPRERRQNHDCRIDGIASQPQVDRSFQSFLNSAEGPGSPDAATSGNQMQSLGSGFIIDATGLIVTNNHVIDGAQTMSVILADGTSLPATLVGRDTVNDIALLRVHRRVPWPRSISGRRARPGSATGSSPSAIPTVLAAR